MRIYEVTDKSLQKYYLDETEIHEAYANFGRLVQVVQYDLVNYLDITDQINGDYFDE